jgi:hypothetical protein
MKKVIDCTLYNTETAELLHNWSNGKFTSDFGYCRESLYKTKKGAYFIMGEGGPMSKYAKSCGSNTSGSEDIQVLCLTEATRWLEEHAGSDVLIEKFADFIVEG